MAIEKNSQLHRFSGKYRPITHATLDGNYTLDYIDTFSQTSTGHTRGSYSGRGDGGGNWLMNKETYSVMPSYLKTFYVDGPLVWTGPIGAVVPSDMLPLSENTLKGQGTKAIALSAPTNPTFDLAQFVGELREGAPKIVGSGLLKEKTRFLKGAGSEYLNVEFGWKPLVNDVQNFARAVKKSDEIIDNYRKGSDTKIRRRHIYDPVRTSWSASGGGPCSPGIMTESIYAQGSRTKTAVSKSWFSGAFRYHVPTGSSTLDKLKQHVSYADKLLGVRITPELMWNLAPWTWAADWFANTGDILKNISNLGSDGLAMQYGYMMNHVETVETMTWKVDSYTKPTGSYTRVKTQKLRLAASPFGFSVTWDGLSTRQQAIAAAIGVTRKR
jgi:hypothetical protein